MTWTCSANGGMGRVFAEARAPSTWGRFLRAFTFGHVRQLDAVAARLLVNLAAHTPLLPGADRVAFVDVDDTVRETHGYAKQVSASALRGSAAGGTRRRCPGGVAPAGRSA
jgi:hypothetical protein